VTKSTRCIENVSEFDNAVEAMDELFKLVVSTMSPNEPIILRCNLPTWQAEDGSPGFGIDLYDLRSHHAKSLVFVHSFLDKLKTAGFQASYKLTVSAATACTLIRVTSGDPYSVAAQNQLDQMCALLKEKLSSVVKRERHYVTTLCSIPAAILT